MSFMPSSFGGWACVVCLVSLLSYLWPEPTDLLEEADAWLPTFNLSELRRFNGEAREEPWQFVATVDRSAGAPLGLEVSKGHDSLVVQAVSDDASALIPAWNLARPEMSVKPGDKIQVVSGMKGEAGALMVELKRPKVHELTLVREAAKDSTLLLAIWGRVFDVSSGAEFYAPGGGYHMFAGHDVTRCMALTSTDKALLDKGLESPSKNTLSNLNESYWLTYMAKYPVVGILRDPPYDPSEFDHFAGPFSAARATKGANNTGSGRKRKRKSRCPVTRAARAVGDAVVSMLPRALLGGPSSEKGAGEL